MPDEADNATTFGYPGSRTSVSGHAVYPQARCVVLVECATHAILGANVGPYSSGEWTLGAKLRPRIGPGMLCLADRGFNGYEHWRLASATGAVSLWRCSDTRQLPVLRMFDDGSFISSISPPVGGVKQVAEQAITVRVIEHTRPGHAQAQPRDRLLTTLLAAKAAPALKLAALYHLVGDKYLGRSTTTILAG